MSDGVRPGSAERPELASLKPFPSPAPGHQNYPRGAACYAWAWLRSLHPPGPCGGLWELCCGHCSDHALGTGMIP